MKGVEEYIREKYLVEKPNFKEFDEIIKDTKKFLKQKMKEVEKEKKRLHLLCKDNTFSHTFFWEKMQKGDMIFYEFKCNCGAELFYFVVDFEHKRINSHKQLYRHWEFKVAENLLFLIMLYTENDEEKADYCIL